MFDNRIAGDSLCYLYLGRVRNTLDVNACHRFYWAVSKGKYR